MEENKNQLVVLPSLKMNSIQEEEEEIYKVQQNKALAMNLNEASSFLLGLHTDISTRIAPHIFL